MKLNRFDALAECESTDVEMTQADCHAHSGSGDDSLAGKHYAHPNDVFSHTSKQHTQHALLLVHDSSNQKACSVRIPLGALRSATTVTHFLQKKGLAVPETSLLTVHEDCLPCSLKVVKPLMDVPLLSAPPSADVIMHLFNVSNAPSACVLHEFANVHPDCYKTLSDCAQSPAVTMPGGVEPASFQQYLEAAFEASVLTDAILYNDCDKVEMKAEWCTWNTGLLWKHPTDRSADGYIYLFFKRSLSKLGKTKLGAFPLVSSRQAKPWTMNKPKLISDVQKWLNGAPPPPPPPQELVAHILASKVQHLCDLELTPQTPERVSESTQHAFNSAASEGMNLPPVLTRTSASSTSSSGSWRKMQVSSPASSPASKAADGSTKSRRRRSRRGSGTNKSDSGSMPGTPGTPTQADVKLFGEARLTSLVTILSQARNNVPAMSCGWISSFSHPSAFDSSFTGGHTAEWWSSRMDWGM